MVDPGGIEPPSVQCECAVLPLNYGPDRDILHGGDGFSNPWCYESEQSTIHTYHELYREAILVHGGPEGN